MNAVTGVRSDGEPWIALENVSMSYRGAAAETRVLIDVDLTIERGSFEALLGPSGSGKSTLLHLIAGLEAPTAGSVSVAGRDPSTLNAQARASWRANEIGFVFQNYRLFPMLTALENVALPLQLAPLPRREHRARARTALKIVGLDAWADHVPAQLSGGQQQRVAIARAIVTDPSVIIADEPTGDLDRRTADHILSLFHELNHGFGKTIVMVTHDLIAARHASVIHQLDKGRLVAEPRLAPATTPPAGVRWPRPELPSLAKTQHGIGSPSHVEVTKILMLDSSARRR